MREVIVRIKDDLDNELIADKTVTFSYDGQAYEIDLTAEHCDEFAAAIAPYIHAGRKVTKRKHRGTANATVTANGQEQIVTPPDSEKARAERDRIRRWAKANGHEVSERGVIPRHVVEAYDSRKAKR